MSSRESDNANPAPRRTGPDAYPSGTPPYGVPGFPGGDRAGAGAPSGPAAAKASGNGRGPAAGGEDDAPKTETTLTTRIRINIPGSRPIPPVVVRSPVKNEDGTADEAPAGDGQAAPRLRAAAAAPAKADAKARTATPPGPAPERQGPGAPAGSGASEAESTGEWFRPRQRKGAQDTPAAVPAGAPAPAAGRA
ncbi:hypothetical protein ACWEQL_29865, partial [Kitasatospora sp. NPDC004240]